MLDRLVILCAPMMAAVAGCGHSEGSKPQKIDPAVWNSPHSGLVGHEQPVLVAEGNVPLVFQAFHDSPFHVSDAAGAPIARGRVKASEIVRVDARGVYVGDEQLSSGPLAQDHRYQIYVDPTTSGP